MGLIFRYSYRCLPLAHLLPEARVLNDAVEDIGWKMIKDPKAKLSTNEDDNDPLKSITLARSQDLKKEFRRILNQLDLILHTAEALIQLELLSHRLPHCVVGVEAPRDRAGAIERANDDLVRIRKEGRKYIVSQGSK